MTEPAVVLRIDNLRDAGILRGALREQIVSIAQYLNDEAQSLDKRREGEEPWVKEDEFMSSAQELHVISTILADLGRQIDDTLLERRERTDGDR